MTDRQDLRARLPELPEPVAQRHAASYTNILWLAPAPFEFPPDGMGLYTADQMRAYALEAAAQLGRVGDETIDCEIAVAPATIFSVGVKLSTVVSAVRARKEAEGTFAFTAKVRDRVAEPQLPAGVPEGWALVPVKPTESMLEALGNTPWVIDGHTEGNTFIQKEYRDQRYVTDGWEAMLNAAPSPPATPQPDSAAPDGGGVEQMARELLARQYDKKPHNSAMSSALRNESRLPFGVSQEHINAIIAALSAPKQVGGLPDAVLLDRGFQIKDGVVTPTLLFGFNPDDWAARDRFAAMINTSPQAAPVPVEGEGPAEAQILAAMQAYSSGKNDFRESIRRALIAANTPPPSQPAVELEQFRPAVDVWINRAAEGMRSHMHPASEQERESYEAAASDFEQGTRLLALIDGAKAGRAKGEES